MIIAILAATALFVEAAPTAESSPSPPAATAPSAHVSPLTIQGKTHEEAYDKDVVCRSEPVLGSLFPKKICASRQSRTERTRVDQKQLRDSLLYSPLIVH